MITKIIFGLCAFVSFMIGPFFTISLVKQIWGKGKKVLYALALICGTTYFFSIEFALGILIRKGSMWYVFFVLSVLIAIISYILLKKFANRDG